MMFVIDESGRVEYSVINHPEEQGDGSSMSLAPIQNGLQSASGSFDQDFYQQTPSPDYIPQGLGPVMGGNTANGRDGYSPSWMTLATMGIGLVGDFRSAHEASVLSNYLREWVDVNNKVLGWSSKTTFELTTKAPIWRCGKMLGYLGLGIGTGIDVIGVRNYYMNPEANFVTSPGKAGLNLVIGVYSLAANPLAGALYFGIDALYPGGWPNALNNAGKTIEANQDILGPSWNIYREYGNK